MKAARYGRAPEDLGLIDIAPAEMMFWLYCPIKAPGGEIVLPPNLKQFLPIVNAVCENAATAVYRQSYLYLTAKTMHVSSQCPGNRPGWHSDGFMTDDINYIWYDSNPTMFWVPDTLRPFSRHDDVSLLEMDEAARNDGLHHKAYPCRHLLKLDETVIHRVGDVRDEGIRTFVKISMSDSRYDLIGNSINHGLDVGWTPTARRADARNQPSSSEAV